MSPRTVWLNLFRHIRRPFNQRKLIVIQASSYCSRRKLPCCAQYSIRIDTKPTTVAELECTKRKQTPCTQAERRDGEIGRQALVALQSPCFDAAGTVATARGAQKSSIHTIVIDISLKALAWFFVDWQSGSVLSSNPST